MGKPTKYGQNRVKGYSKYESALQAGYSHSTARNPSAIERTREYQDFWLEIDREMDLQGITPSYIVGKLNEALDAKNSTFYRGQEIIGTTMSPMSLKAVEICLELKFKAEAIRFKERRVVEAEIIEEVDTMSDKELNQYLTSLCD